MTDVNVEFQTVENRKLYNVVFQATMWERNDKAIKNVTMGSHIHAISTGLVSFFLSCFSIGMVSVPDPSPFSPKGILYIFQSSSL